MPFVHFPTLYMRRHRSRRITAIRRNDEPARAREIVLPTAVELAISRAEVKEKTAAMRVGCPFLQSEGLVCLRYAPKYEVHCHPNDMGREPGRCYFRVEK